MYFLSYTSLAKLIVGTNERAKIIIIIIIIHHHNPSSSSSSIIIIIIIIIIHHHHNHYHHHLYNALAHIFTPTYHHQIIIPCHDTSSSNDCRHGDEFHIVIWREKENKWVWLKWNTISYAKKIKNRYLCIK